MQDQDISLLSNEQLNKKLAIKLGLAKGGKVLSYYQRPSLDFCGNWGLLMPLIIANDISFQHKFENGNTFVAMSDYDEDGNMVLSKHNSDPQRALSECLLMTLSK